MGQHLVTTALILGSMTCTVLANLSLKIGAQHHHLAVWPANLVNRHVALGAAWFALAFLFYALVLRRLPLNVAQSIFSLQFVLVILAANWVLHESIGGVRWLGIALIGIGLLVASLPSSISKPVETSAQEISD